MNTREFSLKPFKKIISSSDLEISGEIGRRLNTLYIRYDIKGNIKDLFIPKKSNSPSRKYGLWENTCLEFFLAIRDVPKYWEFNLSPSEDWNVFNFKDYRFGMSEELSFTSLPFRVESQSKSLVIDINCDMDKLFQEYLPIEIGISAVIRCKNDELIYWALTHCEPEADFHSRAGFIFKF